ncbi:hypothetical protein GUJ93_ZPchr0014g47319 [Zizania palustris]|uniref:Uncharacterized protein n=1 Tax=Zizania palustris TaxID=103762 RepID=A0A8J5SXC1_ZIZPA|nr:hypothetical protein GUJ93_ZPchr0014g47319 [Zizania palustris]
MKRSMLPWIGVTSTSGVSKLLAHATPPVLHRGVSKVVAHKFGVPLRIVQKAWHNGKNGARCHRLYPHGSTIGDEEGPEMAEPGGGERLTMTRAGDEEGPAAGRGRQRLGQWQRSRRSPLSLRRRIRGVWSWVLTVVCDPCGSSRPTTATLYSAMSCASGATAAAAKPSGCH